MDFEFFFFFNRRGIIILFGLLFFTAVQLFMPFSAAFPDALLTDKAKRIP